MCGGVEAQLKGAFALPIQILPSPRACYKPRLLSSRSPHLGLRGLTAYPFLKGGEVLSGIINRIPKNVGSTRSLAQRDELTDYGSNAIDDE